MLPPERMEPLYIWADLRDIPELPEVCERYETLFRLREPVVFQLVGLLDYLLGRPRFGREITVYRVVLRWQHYLQASKTARFTKASTNGSWIKA